MTVDDKGLQMNAFAMKWAVLFFMCMQTAGFSLVANLSRKINNEKYSAVEVTLVAELIKLVISGYLSIKAGEGHCGSQIFDMLKNGKKMIIVVIFYLASNLLSIYICGFIDASTFAVCEQMKIFTTAFFAKVVMGKHYSAAKWRALLLLVVGCVLVISPIYNVAPGAEAVTVEEAARAHRDSADQTWGLMVVAFQITISGFIAVYFEAMLKDKTVVVGIWERNFQLAAFSIIMLLVMKITENNYIFATTAEAAAQDSDNRPLFCGWTYLAVALVLLQSVGGLLVAATLKYADAVLKCFATSVSIMITSVVGYYYLDNIIDVFVGLGMLTTVIAICNYTLDVDVVAVDEGHDEAGRGRAEADDEPFLYDKLAKGDSSA